MKQSVAPRGHAIPKQEVRMEFLLIGKSNKPMMTFETWPKVRAVISAFPTLVVPEKACMNPQYLERPTTGLKMGRLIRAKNRNI